MIVFLATLHLGVILFLAYRLEKPGDINPRLFRAALLLKLAAGIALGLLYKYYFETGDTLNFFEQASDHAATFMADPGGYFHFLWDDVSEPWKGTSRSLFFVKLTSIVAITAGRNYWITSLWFSFASFTASIYLLRVILRRLPHALIAGAIAFLFFPSVVFWGSGIIKESVGLTGLLVLAAIFLKIIWNFRITRVEWLLAVLAVWMTWNLKYYWLSIFVPVTLTTIAIDFIRRRKKIPAPWLIPAWLALFAILIFAVSILHPNFHRDRLARVIYENHMAFASLSDPGDVIHYDNFSSNWTSLARNSPWALISGLFRPFLSESDSAPKTWVAFENLAILVIVVSALPKLKFFLQAPDRLVTFSVILYTALLCVFLALSTPNFGSLARYKSGFLPFFIFLICYNSRLLDAPQSQPKPVSNS